MSDIDKQLDEILRTTIVLGVDDGQPYIKYSDIAVDRIKQLIVDEFEKMIAKSEVVIDSTFNMSSKKGKK